MSWSPTCRGWVAVRKKHFFNEHLEYSIYIWLTIVVVLFVSAENLLHCNINNNKNLKMENVGRNKHCVFPLWFSVFCQPSHDSYMGSNWSLECGQTIAETVHLYCLTILLIESREMDCRGLRTFFCYFWSNNEILRYIYSSTNLSIYCMYKYAYL